MRFNFIAAVIVCAVALLIALDRRWTLRKTRHWRPTMATVTASRTRLIGDSSDVFVDVAFLFNGSNAYARNLATKGNSLADYPCGHQIRLLVDPNNSSKCTLEELVQAP
ncbi:DUF3592 domain-containing protein [Rhizobium sp. L51/94]|uniref:DUF3592 domain-containing protein n=1 Tax=unclassified Rhizobium TaxID=2613769 RepID=UPI0035A8DE54